jgi:lipopolysaccharide transport system ATP-binding protein
VGVIGRNGAGKSTLLKILSRITEPTEGFVDLYGRVGSLLEVGTGFHPELTGRENIYLNGSIIGMKKHEIDRKFDDIVAFAESHQFIDTPVKYFSSGMYMRLAFAVAAHLEPEILLVDEVLAVGDAGFQKKCLGKIESVAKEGRTVVFVTHNMAAIRSLCQKCFLFEEGQLALNGNIDRCIDLYLSQPATGNCGSLVTFTKPSMKSLWIRSAQIISNDSPSTTVCMGDSLSISVEFASERLIRQPRFGFIIRASDGSPVVNSNNRYQVSPHYLPPVRGGQIRCDLGMLPLVAGRYQIDLYLGDEAEDSHIVEKALSFEVTERDIWGQGQVPPSSVSYFWWPTKFHFLSA